MTNMSGGRQACPETMPEGAPFFLDELQKTHLSRHVKNNTSFVHFAVQNGSCSRMCLERPLVFHDLSIYTQTSRRRNGRKQIESPSYASRSGMRNMWCRSYEHMMNRPQIPTSVAPGSDSKDPCKAWTKMRPDTASMMGPLWPKWAPKSFPQKVNAYHGSSFICQVSQLV